ncbi:MAG: hypothetical protein QS721_09025 [Candidatus Endonucleobacter sp. (ex Gigantidas childressi)]|nr:hypothetical protein [Candidatus Endonucleobacter sp. (ex Gigantidas childressi)]
MNKKQLYKILLYALTILVSYQYVGQILACELMELYKDDFGEINNIKKKEIGVKVFENLKFTEKDIHQYKECYHSSMQSDGFNRDRKKTISLVGKGNKDSVYGKQTIFNEMSILGGWLVRYAMNNKYDYSFISHMLSFHRHLIAQYMGTEISILPKFGNPCGKDKCIATQMKTISVKSNDLARKNALLNYDKYHCACGLDDFLRGKNIDPQLVVKIRPFLEAESSRYPLSALIIFKKNCIYVDSQEINRCSDIFERAIMENGVLVIHGYALYKGAVSGEIRGIIEGYINNLQTLSVLEILSDDSLTEAVRMIAKIAFTESHLTLIERGGGSFVEMLVDGLLLAIGLSSYLIQVDRESLWGSAMCYHSSNEYIEAWMPRLLHCASVIKK